MRDGGPVEAAAFVGEAVGELIQLAHVHRLDMLCYLLDMARLEAAEIIRSRSRRRISARCSLGAMVM